MRVKGNGITPDHLIPSRKAMLFQGGIKDLGVAVPGASWHKGLLSSARSSSYMASAEIRKEKIA